MPAESTAPAHIDITVASTLPRRKLRETETKSFPEMEVSLDSAKPHSWTN